VVVDNGSGVADGSRREKERKRGLEEWDERVGVEGDFASD
jgi:hypothetical protein